MDPKNKYQKCLLILIDRYRSMASIRKGKGKTAKSPAQRAGNVVETFVLHENRARRERNNNKRVGELKNVLLLIPLFRILRSSSSKRARSLTAY